MPCATRRRSAGTHTASGHNRKEHGVRAAWLRYGWLGLLVLGGCATYTPRPIDLAAQRATVEAAALDDATSRDALRACALDVPPAWTPAALTCIAYARSPRLKEARATVNQAIAATRSAKARAAPTLSISSDRDLHPQADSTRWLWGFILDIPLDGGRRRALRSALAESAARGAVLDYADAAWTVRRDLHAGLRALWLAQRQADLAARTLVVAENWQRTVESRIAAGEAAAAERVAALAAVNRARADRIVAEQHGQSGASQAAQAIGVSMTALLTASWEPPDEASAIPADFVKNSRDEALLHRFDLARALETYTTRELELRQQVQAQYPQITLGPGYTYDHGVQKLNFNLGLALPNFDLNAGPIAEAEAHRAAAAAHVDTVLAQIVAEIDAATQAVALAQRNLAESNEAARRANAALAQIAVARRLGEEDRAAELAADVDVLTAEQAELAARGAVNDALGALEDALRTPLDAHERALRASPEINP
jgi:cobalt-zinc-cadmium efflux system outer membrane protein